MDKILFYINFVWENIYLKGFVLYSIYAIFVYFILNPTIKHLFIKIVKKTKTNLDNEIYGKTRTLWKSLFYLLGVNLIYKFYFLHILSENFVVVYNIILSIELVILFFIFKRTIFILLKYGRKKYENIFTKNIANIVKIFLNIISVGIFILLILSIWGVNITPLLASAGIFGLAIAMASKSIIENFLSGIILFADKTVNVGDTIILSDGTTAVVEEVNIRTTRLRTFDGNVVIIPNSELLNNKITNKSIEEIAPYKRVVVTVGISYGDDSEKAKEILKNFLLEIDGADKETVVVYVDELADWSVNITGKIMVEADKWSYLLEKEVLEKVYKQFPKNGLNFPFPTYDINLQK